ncbi:aminotransferase class I/II-fold pyridoxal phosphate-dependent enzyme [Thermobrachium celere]|uniref:Arginine decarboxylase / Lysine decarboxylase n=1 Tax=Thermobrachium celere DSM 8682 TaxID=941824 RepID=R7RLX9_9CLOT|nr:aminotransferase class V-fold PLP-dependent enzyme [Thermobrachium celere]CDF57172.1 Arginine decarboxylase / Lysine decarboxylase [Thermobrachium celere DSM 8682]
MSLIDDLIKYKQEVDVRFHMPGHKGNTFEFDELERLREHLFSIDVTEVEGTDNLHVPNGIIKNAQDRAKEFYGAEHSFFLVNGSTAGIYSMILGLLKPKDKIIVQRNCHRSVYSACMLGDLDVVYVNPVIDEEFHIPVSLDIEQILDVMDSNLDAKAIVLTYPTYYGTCFDLKRVIQEAKKRGMYVLIDSAHGAHFKCSSKLPEDAIELGADAVVYSLHKTTPALTQCSILNVNNVDITGIKFMLSIFQTTSPSYVLMSSIDAAVNIMNKKGTELIERTILSANKLRERLKIIGFDSINLDRIGRYNIKDIDTTRIVISSNIGGYLLDEILRKKYKIQVEMSDNKNIVLIGSMFDKEDYYEYLYKALCDIKNKYLEGNKQNINYADVKYKIRMNMRSAYYSKKERVLLKNAKGLVSAEMIVPYPPGVPILMPGEEITEDIIHFINENRGKIALNGISDKNAEYIYVVKE